MLNELTNSNKEMLMGVVKSNLSVVIEGKHSDAVTQVVTFLKQYTIMPMVILGETPASEMVREIKHKLTTHNGIILICLRPSAKMLDALGDHIKIKVYKDEDRKVYLHYVVVDRSQPNLNLSDERNLLIIKRREVHGLFEELESNVKDTATHSVKNCDELQTMCNLIKGRFSEWKLDRDVSLKPVTFKVLSSSINTPSDVEALKRAMDILANVNRLKVYVYLIISTYLELPTELKNLIKEPDYEVIDLN